MVAVSSADVSLELPEKCGTCGLGPSIAGNMRRLADQVLRAQEEERARLARELHDETGQSLTLLLVRLRLLEDVTHEAAARTEIEELRDLVGGTLDGVRRLAIAFGPAELEELGLAAALDSLVGRVIRETGRTVETEIVPPPAEPSHSVGLALYRVAQEAMTNAIRHGHPHRVWLRLRPQGDGIRLEVDDDGVGFDTSAQGEGIGILGMAERMALVNGTFALTSRPGHGTRVLAEVPSNGRTRS